MGFTARINRAKIFFTVKFLVLVPVLAAALTGTRGGWLWSLGVALGLAVGVLIGNTVQTLPLTPDHPLYNGWLP